MNTFQRSTVTIAIAFGVMLASMAPGLAIGAGEVQQQPTLPTGAKSQTKAELDAIRTQNALDAERQKGLKGGAIQAGPTVPSLGTEPIPVIGGAGSRNSGNSVGSTSARVTMVAGPIGQLLATIQTSDGLVVARVGDRLPGVGAIKSIAVNQVIADDGKRIITIPFAAEPTSNLIQGPNASPAGAIPFVNLSGSR